MRSLLLTLIIILSISFNITAQVPSIPFPSNQGEEGDPPSAKDPFGQRLVFGGTIGAQFGSSTQVNLSPIIGYKVTEKLTSGIGITYIYYKYKYYTGSGNQTYTEQDHIVGGSLWSEYKVIPQAFLHAEYGLLNLSVPVQSANGYYYGETTRDNINLFLVGGGYYQSLGSNAGIQFSILWDLIEAKYSPYTNPIIRIGFVAGF